ncbi:C2H2 type transcription factor BrlA [Aspergillus brunneoviolaceus CBS 621.78]|uniref:Regulatory protein brlA n=1 Tax=Aspergillus brunneoviolaceus CBS 621.78 TaxID=1450534 RepID=A0ACD1GBJ3_9EURO|nr:regulatory protein brlA [Aspergillus brunneoviolaceus CBS 621.78]RAH46486.1 regulatory protein brlA [Aspergillus brunneoviolaceus CBS 621.78]
MTSNCAKLEVLPAPPRKHREENEEMRPQGSLSDRLTVEVDCTSLGSNECPSMTSFSPLDSPKTTPTSVYSHGSLQSPGWHEGGSFPSQAYERHSGSTPMRSAFRLASMTSNDVMGMPYSNMEPQERMPMTDFLSGYDENVEQFWIPSEAPKTYEHGVQGLPYPPHMHHYTTMARPNYRQHHAPYLPESATNPCLSRSIFHHQHERIPTSMSMGNMIPWMAPPAESIAPQTIAPSQVAPVTPPPSYSEFPASLGTFKAHTPATPVRSCSLGSGSGSDTPISRLSGSMDYMDDFSQSPVYRDGLVRVQRQPSRKTARKQASKQSMSLENLPSIIKQVQFKCKEPGCKGRFKRQEHLKRHMKSHSKEKPHVCWVPGCHRAFSRSDNLNAHYTKTHSKRGGRNRYVATLDENSPDYNPEYRGQLTPDGRPLYSQKHDETMPGTRHMSVEWDD